MADFNIAYQRTKKWEGNHVYSILAGDAGGETYAGLARKYNPQFTGWAYIDEQKKNFPNGRIPNGTKFTILESHIVNFYYKEYWLKIAKGDKIKNQDVANLVFDTVVNHGKGERVVNQAIVAAGGKIKVTDNITSDTLNFLNAIPEKVYPFIVKQREAYIKSLSDFNLFGNGWLNRLADFPKTIFAGAVAGVTDMITSTDKVKKKS